MNYTTLASPEQLDRATKALTDHGFHVEHVPTAGDALAFIKQRIPTGASVMNGTSKTLEAIGYIDYLKSGTHGWSNLHENILAEKDPAMQALLRRQAVVSDYYLGSVHAATETGELVISSNTGSQLPHLAYTSPNLILVAGTHKIVPTLSVAFERLEQYIVPLEDKRLMGVYNVHTMHSKTLILRRENPMMKRNVTIVFVDEVLGF